jgi:hypothetical protein
LPKAFQTRFTWQLEPSLLHLPILWILILSFWTKETQRTALQKTSISQDERNFSYKASRDGILGHKFNKRLESSTGGFERKSFSSLVLKLLTKNTRVCSWRAFV